LNDATQFVLVGLAEGSTVLELEAPILGEAVPQIFEQLPLWEYSPKRDQTALSLVEEAARDAINGNSKSDLLDRNILELFSSLDRVLNFGFDAISLTDELQDSLPVRVTPAGLETAEKLKRESPSPEKTIISGYLDELTHSKRAFGLRLVSGQSIRGVLPAGDPAAYASLWGKRVVVDGEASFKLSGAVSVIVAAHIQSATETDSAWERLPRPRQMSVEDIYPRAARRPGTSGMDQVYGCWPGDETTEQIVTALSEIR
jgi:hypothetical protein